MNDCLNTLFLGRKFKNLIKQSFAPIRKKYGLKQVEIEVLNYLASNPGATSTDVYRELNLNKGHVSQSTIHLQAKNLIELHINPNDKRSATYSITNKGHDVYNEIVKIHDDVVSKLFNDMSEKEKNAFFDSSCKVINNIDFMLS